MWCSETCELQTPICLYNMKPTSEPQRLPVIESSGTSNTWWVDGWLQAASCPHQTFESHRTYKSSLPASSHHNKHCQASFNNFCICAVTAPHINYQMAPTLLRSATGKTGTVSVRALLRNAAKPAVKPVQKKTASKTVSSKVPTAAPKPGQLQLGFTKVSIVCSM
jgi:hypothetical protein